MEGQSLTELFAGRDINLNEAMNRLKSVARAEGLPFGDRKMTYNSRRAQELGKWAEEQGKSEAFHQAMFRAYFVDGLNLSDLDVLEQAAVSIGLDGGRAREVVDKGEYAAAVDRDWDYSRKCLIQAIPSFRANERTIVGSQTYEAIAALVRQSEIALLSGKKV